MYTFKVGSLCHINHYYLNTIFSRDKESLNLIFIVSRYLNHCRASANMITMHYLILRKLALRCLFSSIPVSFPRYPDSNLGMRNSPSCCDQVLLLPLPLFSPNVAQHNIATEVWRQEYGSSGPAAARIHQDLSVIVDLL